jgi:hypothetical protein
MTVIISLGFGQIIQGKRVIFFRRRRRFPAHIRLLSDMTRMWRYFVRAHDISRAHIARHNGYAQDATLPLNATILAVATVAFRPNYCLKTSSAFLQISVLRLASNLNNPLIVIEVTDRRLM